MDEIVDKIITWGEPIIQFLEKNWMYIVGGILLFIMWLLAKKIGLL